MAYNASIAAATAMAPQLGTLSSTTTPTSTQATLVWDAAYDRVRLALASSGLATTFTSASIAEGWAERVEMLLTSGSLLLAKGSIGTGAESTAQTLLAAGEAALASLPEQREALLAQGATGAAGGLDSRVGSHWRRAADPQYNDTPGTGDQPYASEPIFPDNSDL